MLYDLSVGHDRVAELIEALQSCLGYFVLQNLLGTLSVRYRHSLDKERDYEVVGGVAGLLVVVVHGHLAELRGVVHHTHGVFIVQQNNEVFEWFAGVGGPHVGNVLETFKQSICKMSNGQIN